MNDFFDELIQYIDENKDKRFQNSDIEQKYYNKILERQQAHKKTNTGAIKNINKLMQYCIAEILIGYSSGVFDYLYDNLGETYYFYLLDMFSEVEYENSKIRQLNTTLIENISYENSEIYIKYKGNKIKVFYEPNCSVTYKLLPNPIKLSSNCWNNFESSCIAPINSISTTVPWKITGDVHLDKKTDQYIINNMEFIADFNLHNINILARYSGLGHSAWICESSLDGQYYDEWRACEWPGNNICWNTTQKGRIYLVRNHHIITSIQGEGNGSFNNISFNKLKDLLERL